MRLLHTSELCFHEFNDNELPPYAILSHTWGKEEVTYSEFLQGKRNEKLISCCRLAASESWNYIWIDTCCIDKSSSAELSEAINSMYKWYQRSEICYAYLVDIQIHVPNNQPHKRFVESRWFTRGWTVQELLAPQRLIFYDCDWVEIGSKQSLQVYVSEATRIERMYLEKPNKASVAAKMSWVSRRKTTRIEDMAYCLLGIFGINIPLLYGEGEKAFARLQREIINQYDDQSLFAWADKDLKRSGMLARAPSSFIDSGNVVETRDASFTHKMPYRMTNKGLEIETPVIHHDSNLVNVDGKKLGQMSNQVWIVPLACQRRNDYGNVITITLESEKVRAGDFGAERVSRTNPARLETRPWPSHAVQDTTVSFIVVPNADISDKPKIRQSWYTTKIVTRRTAKGKLLEMEDLSPGLPKFSRDGDITFESIHSISPEFRAARFNCVDGRSFLLYWYQFTSPKDPPVINIIVAKEGQTLEKVHYQYADQQNSTRLELNSINTFLEDLGAGTRLRIQLRHERRSDKLHLIIDIDVTSIDRDKIF